MGIYNIEQRRINAVYFNVDMNNVRQRRNNVVIFNVGFHNVGKRRNNVVKMSISKENKKKISNRILGVQSFNRYFIIFFTSLPMLREICRRVLAKPRKFLKDHGKYCIARTSFKGALSGLRQFLATESPLKMMKNAFYFTSKALSKGLSIK